MGAPGNTDRSDTKEMVRYYQEHHKTAIEAGGFKAADWGWVSLKELMDFLQELKDKHGADGLRTYFGAHHKEIMPPDYPRPYFGYNTVIFVGTKKNGKLNQDIEFHAEIDGGNFDLVIGKSQGVKDKLVALDDEDKQHLHPPDDDDNDLHRNGDSVLLSN